MKNRTDETKKFLETSVINIIQNKCAYFELGIKNILLFTII